MASAVGDDGDYGIFSVIRVVRRWREPGTITLHTRTTYDK